MLKIERTVCITCKILMDIFVTYFYNKDYLPTCITRTNIAATGRTCVTIRTHSFAFMSAITFTLASSPSLIHVI